MSAEPTTSDHLVDPSSSRRTALTLLPTARPVLSGRGFGILVAAILAVGLGVVMVVSTSVSAQSRELAALRKEATELGYTAAALTHELQTTSSTSSLALRATELGMVPNPYPAFIDLADGSILGDPTPVTGKEVTYLKKLPDPAPVPDQTEVIVGQATDQIAPEQGAVEASGEDPAAEAPLTDAADGALVLPASEEQVVEEQ